MEFHPLPESTEPSEKLGALHLKRLCERSNRIASGKLGDGEHSNEWPLDLLIYDGFKIGIEPTITYLYSGPSLDEFEQWILAHNGGQVSEDTIDRINSAIRTSLETLDRPASYRSTNDEVCDQILSPDQIAFWDENGYLIVPNAISTEQCEAAVSAVWDHLGKTPNDPSTWYTPREGWNGMMVQLFQNQALDDCRTSRTIYRAFRQLWGTPHLETSADRVSFNPPETPEWQYQGPRMHWDTSLHQPIPLGLQGLIYLTDTASNQGAFTCVPGFHRKVEKWLATLPTSINPREVDFDELGATPIPGKAGDLVIWHHALPHSSSANTATLPRIVQYLNMYPSTRVDDRPWI